MDALFADVPATTVPRAKLEAGLGLIDLLIGAKLCSTRGQARRLIGGGGVHVNNQRMSDPETTIGSSHLASENALVLRTGKKRYHLVRFV